MLGLFGSMSVQAQSLGSLEVSGRLRVGSKSEKITRKRFYLFTGGLDQHKTLTDKLKAADVTSRECFYCQMKASPEYIAWLKTGDCESPYCREITKDDTTKVPEFQAAYQKGIKQYRGKADIAQMWLTTNLPPTLRDGFYQQRKSLLKSLLGTLKPIQSSMTDTVSVKAIFIDIPLKSSDISELFLISNLIPIEIGDKSYVWACEVEIGADKTEKLVLPVADSSKLIKKCELIVKDLPKCTGGSCNTK